MVLQQAIMLDPSLISFGDNWNREYTCYPVYFHIFILALSETLGGVTDFCNTRYIDPLDF